MLPVVSDLRSGSIDLSASERSRYARHLTLPEVGIAGQRKLKAARVLCIGAGGLGSPVAMHLAAAGVGEIGIVDFDRVDFSNLQRQLIHGTSDVGRLKTESAAERIHEINPEVTVTAHEVRLSAANALAIAEPYDLVVDGTDNFPTRYLSNDLSALTRKPNVHGSIFRFEGQVSVFAPHLGGPCYRCLFPDPPAPGLVPSCSEGGVLGILPGIVGAMQANEAVKLLLGIGEPLVGRLVHFDALTFRFREIRLRRDPRCALCGETPSLTELEDLEFSCDMNPPALPEIDVHALAARIAQDRPFVLLDVREPEELEIARLPGSTAIPLGDLPERLGELDPVAETIVHCKAGGRSAKALRLLLDAGFSNACHVQGGIDAWSREIDPSVPPY